MGKEIMYRIQRSIIIIFSILFIGCSIAPSSGVFLINKPYTIISNGTTLYVGGSGSGNYSNIQDAINDASNGDTVFVYDDSSPYYENVIVDKLINLIGENKDTTVIDGRKLNNGVVFFADGITLSGFTIRNCTGDLSHLYAGIRVYTNNNIINNNNIRENGDHGILLEYLSKNNVISENYIAFNGITGILISTNSSSNFISNNIIEYNEVGGYNEGGILLSPSSFNNFIDNNNISNNYRGIILYDSSSNKISNNNIVNNYYALEIDSGKENTVFCNNFTGGQCILLSVTSNNVIINNTINESSSDGPGIDLYYSDYNKIAGNKITNNNYGGAWIRGNSNIVNDNIIELNRGNGIYLGGSGKYNIIEDNIINSNEENGIKLRKSGDYNVIVGNTICDNKLNGIYNNESCRNIFCYNNISFNNGIGIYLVWNSINNIINSNRFSKNLQSINISEYSSFNNNIFHNNFLNNEIKAYDEFNNYWDDGYPSGGNYWDDYNGIDADGDGKGDTPYNISGSDNQDRYPLMYLHINQGAPARPLIGGETSCKIGKEYNYTFLTIDPDGDTVFYYIDWGDNTSSGWVEVKDFGIALIESHKWSYQGTYIIKAKAKDINGEESNWGTFTIIIAKSKIVINSLFLKLIEKFPLLERLLLMLQV